MVTDDSDSIGKLSEKFGAKPSLWKELVDECRQLELNLYGVSFHVGSPEGHHNSQFFSILRLLLTIRKCYNGEQYRRSLQDAKEVYNLAKEAGLLLQIVDIGGGFTGTDDTFFQSVAAIIRNSISEIFSETSVKVKKTKI